MSFAATDWFIGCTHFGDVAPLLRERYGDFETIYEHDEIIIENINKFVKPNDNLWILGDLGNLDVVRELNGLRKYLVKGNHDHYNNSDYYEYFDAVYSHPVYLSDKLVVSHEPIIKDDSVLNIHAHLHGAILKGQLEGKYLNVGAKMVGYRPVSLSEIEEISNKLPDKNWLFLYEPYAENYVFTELERDDIVMSKEGYVNLEQSRELLYSDIPEVYRFINKGDNNL